MSNKLSWSIIKHFSSKNICGFRFQDVTREFPEMHRVYLARTLADMVDKGMLCRITRDNYHIIPFNANPDTYIPDGHQVAKYMMQNKEYYIGYASAMKIHGFTLQSEIKESEVKESEIKESNAKESEIQESEVKESEIKESEVKESELKEYVVTQKQTKPAIRNFGGIKYQFIQHDATRFFGYDSIWINQIEKAMVSDLEKTIIDITTRPQHGGGIVEVGNAIFQAKDRTDHDKLFYYFSRNMNKSAKKRFLFLTDLLGLEWTIEHERMMKELGSGISILDPAAPDQGSKRSKFGLKINVNPILIKKEVLHRKMS